MIYCPVCQPELATRYEDQGAWTALMCIWCSERQEAAQYPLCNYCHEPILPEDRDRLKAWTARDFHDECLVRSVAGSAAHQLHECTCFGGVREDPPGMTLREAAKLAYDTFNTMRADAGTD